MKKTLACLFLAALAFAGCRRTDVRPFEIEIPALAQENLGEIVQALSVYEGLEPKSVVPDFAAHRISLRYDSMKVAKKNLEMSVALAGYEANGITPESVGAKRAGAK